MTRALVSLLVFALSLGSAARAAAQEEIKIGVIYPLTGAAGSTGLELKNAAELAAEIVNADMKDLSLPLAAGAGLPHLKNAKVKLVFADHQGNPQVGATEAERLITQEKVVALMGCYHSAVTATASQQAERLGVPFLNADSTSSTLTQRGFKWFFRTTPHDELFVQNFFAFLKDLAAKKKVQVKTLAVFNGGSHSVFTDRGNTGGAELNPQIKAATKELSLAFLRSVFDGDDLALRAWPQRFGTLVHRFASPVLR